MASFALSDLVRSVGWLVPLSGRLAGATGTIVRERADGVQEEVSPEDLPQDLRVGVLLGVMSTEGGAGADLVRRVAAVESVLVDYPEAAAILGISVNALRHRVSRFQVPRSAIVRTGRRVQFRRDALTAFKGTGSR